MKFKKIYIEITNICNYHCSFCFDHNRPLTFMPVEEFRAIITKIKPYTDYIYLHVMGEPLLHPEFEKILEIAGEAGLKVNLTTNGSLLGKRAAQLAQPPVRQVNISLHDLEENAAPGEWKQRLEEILRYSDEIASNAYISLRLWNRESSGVDDFNALVLQIISDYYGVTLSDNPKSDSYHNNIKLADRTFLQFAPRFDWPDGETKLTGTSRTCYALRDQIAILVDGTMLPCCIDAGANLKLGNIHTETLKEILQNPLAVRMRKGFQEGKFTEDYCKSCGFIISKSTT